MGFWWKHEVASGISCFYWDPMGSFKEVSAFGPHQHKDYLWHMDTLTILTIRDTFMF
jgi:hypothetical protein